MMRRRRIAVQLRVRAPRGLCLGPFRLWAVRIRQGPNFGFGRIATTDTPRDSAPGERWAQDAQGRVLIMGGVWFAALRCRSVPLRGGRA